MLALFTRPSRSVRRFTLLLTVAPMTLALTACAAFPRLETQTLRGARATAPAAAEGQTSATPRALPKARVDLLSDGQAAKRDKARRSGTGAAESNAVPPIQGGQTFAIQPATSEQIAALVPERSVQASLPPQSLPQFIDTVFGQVLKTPYFTGPNVASRREIVSLRGSVATSSRAFFAMTQAALRDYGLVVTIEGGAVRIVEDPNLVNQTPLFVRDRAMPETPEPSRPVVQFFELKALDVKSVMALLNEAYPNRGKVKFTPREDLNTLVITGNAREVAAAAAVVDQIDRARFADGQIARVEPVFWSAERLADAVVQALKAEGYNVGLGADAAKDPVVFLPLPFSNDILIFSNRKDVYDRALAWIDKLDKPAAFGDQEGVFVYEVENTSASELGALIAQSATESSAGAATTPIRRTTLTRGNSPIVQTQSSPGVGAGKVTVDAAGNRLIFRGTPTEFERAHAVMVALDTPAQQVLIEVTIAEVRLTDETRFGIDWLLNQTSNGDALSVNTRGGSSRQNGGLGATLSHAFPRGTVVAALNAFAQNNNVNILSTPRLMARSGSEAQILIGNDVPIITSQRAADQQTGGNTDVLQTVQYRQTGVILSVKPTVYGDDRVDIDLYQEVSDRSNDAVVGIASPTITNRSVSTKLSLREGTTAVIGGLIQDNFGRKQVGLPLLKDAPLVGQAFRSDELNGVKSELLILVTPYIMRNDDQMGATAATYSASIDRLLRSRGPRTFTLLPWRAPLQTPTAHGGADPRGAVAPIAPAEVAPTVPAPTPVAALARTRVSVLGKGVD